MTPAPRGVVEQHIAELLLHGFDESYRRFREISAGARSRFEAADWPAVQLAVRERIRLEEEQVERTTAELGAVLDLTALDDPTWWRVKRRYVDLLVDHKRPELAETFFNSVSTRALGRAYYLNEFLFVRAAISTEYIPADPQTYRSYYPRR